METIPFFIYTLLLAIGCMFLEWWLVPKRCRKIYHGSPASSYYLSCMYQPIMIYLWLTDRPIYQKAAVAIAYPIRDVPYILGQWNMYFHHFYMFLFSVAAILTPGWPQTLYFITGAFLECGSWTQNMTFLMIDTRHFRLAANVNQAVMAVSHMAGLYWCFTMYHSEVPVFFKVNGLLLIPTMVVRQYNSYTIKKNNV